MAFIVNEIQKRIEITTNSVPATIVIPELENKVIQDVQFFRDGILQSSTDYSIEDGNITPNQGFFLGEKLIIIIN